MCVPTTCPSIPEQTRVCPCARDPGQHCACCCQPCRQRNCRAVPDPRARSAGLSRRLCLLTVVVSAQPLDAKPGGLTFPSAPSSTPSRPMISFKLTAPVDCLPPSNFKSLRRTSQRKIALVCTQHRHDNAYCTTQQSHTDRNGPEAWADRTSPCPAFGACQ